MPRSEARIQANGGLLPLVKWAGGKRWLVGELQPLWKPHRKQRLVEPFAGGLAVSLGLQPERALLNDINTNLINLYCWIQKGIEVDLKMENDKGLYYQYRDRFNELNTNGQADSSETALIFYYLLKTGYNGLCRFNSSGGYNVPHGRHKVINYLSNFSDYQKAFEDWEFACGDFAELELNNDDFIYADPPYVESFSKYHTADFSWEDQKRLAEWLGKHKGPVIASNLATERVKRLYRKHGFSTRTVKALRRISCTGDRTPVDEMLATKGF